jgi:hypothetical protein
MVVFKVNKTERIFNMDSNMSCHLKVPFLNIFLNNNMSTILLLVTENFRSLANYISLASLTSKTVTIHLDSVNLSS